MTFKIAVTGGKGGTGKSTIAVILSKLLSEETNSEVLLVDTDVESPSDHILLGVEREFFESVTMFKPKIIQEKCTKCGECIKACPEHALIGLEGTFPRLIDDLCSGCKVCFYVCQDNAIEKEDEEIGKIYIGEKSRITLLQGELNPGKRQYVTMTTRVVEKSKEISGRFPTVVFDTAPGTGANVFSVLRNADIVVAVTEPTPLGANDLNMLMGLVNKLGKKAFIVLNRSDLPGGKSQLIEDVAKNWGIEIISRIPFSREFIERYASGEPIIDFYQHETFKELRNILKLL